jgi:hypothetical protein
MASFAVRALSAGENALGGIGQSVSNFVGPEGPIARSSFWRNAASSASAAWIAAVLAAAIVAGLSTFY